MKYEHKFKVFLVTHVLIPIIAFIVIISTVEAADCEKHPIYCQIKKNSPRLNKKKAYHLSNVIHKATRKYKIPARIFVGILAQESGYKLGARGCHRGLVLPKCEELEGPESIRIKCKNKPHDFIKEIKVCADFGIGQIYYKTAKGFGFDISLLTTDLEYSIEASAKVLADFKKRYSNKEVDWWTRYNARSKIKRQIYKTLVERYF